MKMFLWVKRKGKERKKKIVGGGQDIYKAHC